MIGLVALRPALIGTAGASGPPALISISLLYSSQYGVGADNNTTTVRAPWFRAVLQGSHQVDDVVQFQVDAANDVSHTLVADDIANGYVDVQLDALSPSTVVVRARVERDAQSSAWTDDYALTILASPFDAIDNVYALNGLQRLLSAYDSAPVRLERSTDNAERDFDLMPDGFISAAQVNAWGRTHTGNVRLHTGYDQSGNSRTLGNSTASLRPVIDTTTIRAAMAFDGGTTRRFAEWENAVGFANNQAAISLVANVNYSALGQEASAAVSAVFVSRNAANSTRASIGTNASGNVHSGGRRLDADGFVLTTGMAATTGVWRVQIGRFSWSEAKLFHRFGSSTETLDPFQTAGSTSATDSTDKPRIGRASSAGGAMTGFIGAAALIRDKLSDAEDLALSTSQFALESLPANRPLIRAGLTASIPDFKAAIIAELFKGAGLPTAFADRRTLGIAVGDAGNPLSGGLAPTGLASWDLFEFDGYDATPTLLGTGKAWVFHPTTWNGRLTVIILGHTSSSAAFSVGNQGQLAKERVEAGDTVAVVTMSTFEGTSADAVTFHNGLAYPDGSFNALGPIFVGQYIRLLNELLVNQSIAPTKPIVVGALSGGACMLPLWMAIDDRVDRGWSHAGFFPLHYKLMGGTGFRDFEQYRPGLWELAATQGSDYLDEVVLATFGGRLFKQSINDQDPSNCTLAIYNAGVQYADHLADVCGLYGGTFEFEVYTNSNHDYPSAMRSDFATFAEAAE